MTSMQSVSFSNSSSEEATMQPVGKINFAEVYDHHYTDVYRFIFRRICDTERSFDLCSQVFLKALENADKFVDRGKPVIAWLYRIALNEIYMQHRKRKVDLVYHVDVAELSDIAQETDDENKSENEVKLVAALRKLKQDEMELIEMRYFEKLSISMMAGVLNQTPNNISVKIFRILGKLKRVLTSIN